MVGGVAPGPVVGELYYKPGGAQSAPQNGRSPVVDLSGDDIINIKLKAPRWTT